MNPKQEVMSSDSKRASDLHYIQLSYFEPKI